MPIEGNGQFAIAGGPMSGMVEVAPDNKAADKMPMITGKPRTGRQDLRLPNEFFGRGLGYGGGGPFTMLDAGNPCGFPGFGGYYPGTYANYRFMRRHPVLAHVRAQIRQPIITNARKMAMKFKPDADETHKQLIKDMFTPDQNVSDVEAATLGLDFGVSPFEQVWETREGRKWMKSRPLAPDGITQLCEKDTGLWSGIKFGPNADEWLNRYECWFFANEMEYDNFYGVSRFENVREYAWFMWLMHCTQLLLTGFKVSGKVAIITTPAGKFTTEDGTEVDWQDSAMRAGNKLADPRSNNWIWIPSLVLPDVASKENIDLAKVSLVSVDVKDFGSYGPVIANLLELIKHDEELMSYGMLRSPRTNQESQHGSRADAEEHTDTGLTDSELIQDRIVTARNKAVDDVGEVNFGPKARGMVWFEAAPLRDRNRSTDNKLIDGVIKNPATAPSFFEQVDFDPVAERLGIKKVNPDSPLRIDAQDAKDDLEGVDDGQDQRPDDPADDPNKDPAKEDPSKGKGA